MNNETAFRRIAAISAIVSVPVALSAWVLFALAAQAEQEVLL